MGTWKVYGVVQRGTGGEGRDQRPTVLQESPQAVLSSGVAPLALTANCTDPILQKRKLRLGDVTKSPSRRVVELGLKPSPLSSRPGASLSLMLEFLTSGHLLSSPCERRVALLHSALHPCRAGSQTPSQRTPAAAAPGKLIEDSGTWAPLTAATTASPALGVLNLKFF